MSQQVSDAIVSSSESQSQQSADRARHWRLQWRRTTQAWERTDGMEFVTLLRSLHLSVRLSCWVSVLVDAPPVWLSAVSASYIASASSHSVSAAHTDFSKISELSRLTSHATLSLSSCSLPLSAVMSRFPPTTTTTPVKVYVGGLEPGVQEQELYELFSRSGTIEKVWIAR